jgi:hypothetical protein
MYRELSDRQASFSALFTEEVNETTLTGILINPIEHEDRTALGQVTEAAALDRNLTSTETLHIRRFDDSMGPLTVRDREDDFMAGLRRLDVQGTADLPTSSDEQHPQRNRENGAKSGDKPGVSRIR